jgi:hypothetical protein
MAIVVANTMKGQTQETYDAVIGKVMDGGKLPQGCQVHIAGPVSEGWRVITVWDSEDDFNRFREEKLIPALREAGAPVAPSIETNPMYRLISA